MQNKFAYLVDLIESPLAKIRYLCDIYNALYQNERVLAAIDPTLYIRGKLNDSSLYAVHAGNYIVVYPCYKLENLTFIVEKEKCHNGVPVSYNLNEGKTHKGYLNVLYNNIMPKGIEIDCHSKGNLYSFVGNELRSHSPHGKEVEKINVSTVLSLQHMPITGIPLPEDYLDTGWVYNVSELTHTDMTDKVLDALTREIDELNEHKSNIEGDATIKSTGKWWNIFGIFETNVFSGIHTTIMWMERISIIYLKWIVVIKGKLVNCRARVQENTAVGV